MLLVCCAVYDHKVQAYMTPFFARSRGEAVRSFSDACMSPEHQFHKHAEDYNLYVVGMFDDDDAAFQPMKLENLGSAADYLPRPVQLKAVEK